MCANCLDKPPERTKDNKFTQQKRRTRGTFSVAAENKHRSRKISNRSYNSNDDQDRLEMLDRLDEDNQDRCD